MARECLRREEGVPLPAGAPAPPRWLARRATLVVVARFVLQAFPLAQACAPLVPGAFAVMSSGIGQRIAVAYSERSRPPEYRSPGRSCPQQVESQTCSIAPTRSV